MSPRQYAAGFFLCAAALIGSQLYGAGSSHTLFGDYRAFWCAAHVLVNGGDPYHAEPMLVCERAAVPWHLYTALPNVAVPSPLPPYAIAAFVPLAMIPFAASSIVFAVIALACAAMSALLCSRLFHIPPIVPACAFALPAAYLWIPYGEIVPVALAGALFSVLMMRRGHMGLAAAALAVAAMEPHIALGAWIAVALFERRMRMPLAITGSALVVLWIAAAPRSVGEYLLQVLPAHALAELPRASQLSWAWSLHALGASNDAAIRAAIVISALGVAAGVCAASMLKRRGWNSDVSVILPIAVGSATASFLHAAQMAFVLPWVFTLWSRSGAAARALWLAVVVLAAVPWLGLLSDPLLTIPAAVAAAAIAGVAMQSRSAALRSSVATAALCGIILFAHAHDRIIGPAPRAFPPNVASTLSSASWGRYIWRRESQITLALWIAKAPFWTAVLLLVGGSLVAATPNKDVVDRIGVEHTPLRT